MYILRKLLSIWLPVKIFVFDQAILPIETDFMITEDGETMLTEDGALMITED